MARKVLVTNKSGASVLAIISEVIANGANTARKQRVHEGSNEFKLARLPVPKKAARRKTN